MPTRRASVDVGISYSSDIEQAIKIALDLIKGNPLVLQDPQPAVVTTELADSSINLQLRAWTKTGDLMSVKNALTIGIIEAYNKRGIEIPFPQMDIHIKEAKETKKETMEIQAQSPRFAAFE
jgi:small-conductance mechanosensitive channel